AFLESEIQRVVRSRLARGRVDVSVGVSGTRGASRLVDASAARGYLEAARSLRQEFGLRDELGLDALLLLPRALVDRETFDPQRLAQEVALLAERSDIAEELSRLESHISQFTGWAREGGEVGKKMEFLLQEMQREVTTILSKAGSLEVTRLGVALKAELEKL